MVATAARQARGAAVVGTGAAGGGLITVAASRFHAPPHFSLSPLVLALADWLCIRASSVWASINGSRAAVHWILWGRDAVSRGVPLTQPISS